MLLYIKDEMVIMRHKIDFMTHWFHMQFEKHCLSLSPCLIGLQIHDNASLGASGMFWVLAAFLQG